MWGLTKRDDSVITPKLSVSSNGQIVMPLTGMEDTGEEKNWKPGKKSRVLFGPVKLEMSIFLEILNRKLYIQVYSSQ